MSSTFNLISDSHFIFVLGRSILLMTLVVIGSVGIGLPVGVIAGLYEFSGRKLFLALLALPLLVPSFLWAIGISQFQILLGVSSFSGVLGHLGTVMAFLCLGLPLVIYSAILSVRSMSNTQIEALRLVGSECWFYFHILKRTAPIALLIGIFAGAMTLSDPGPSQIFGISSVAGEILTSFSALYDFDLARVQCFLLSGLTFGMTLIIVILQSRRLSANLMARDLSLSVLHSVKFGNVLGPLALIATLFVILGIPLLGILRPLFLDFPIAYAGKELLRTLPNTLIYSVSAALMATLAGLVFVLGLGRNKSLRILLLGGSIAMISIPSSFLGLSVLQLGSDLSESWDWLSRSRFTVGVVLAFRFLPVSILLMLKRYVGRSSSWGEAAKVFGVSKLRFLFQVILPYMTPSVIVSLLIVALLSSAEVGIVLLLRPPGEDSFPLTIFTVMANAPESWVAALCFVYILLAGTILSLIYKFGTKRSL